MSVPNREQLVGCTLLVGIVYVDERGRVIDRVQLVGVVRAVSPQVTVDTGEAELFTLPPEHDAFDAAAPGEYRLRATGQIVVNPDFITSWTVQTNP